MLGGDYEVEVKEFDFIDGGAGVRVHGARVGRALRRQRGYPSLCHFT